MKTFAKIVGYAAGVVWLLAGLGADHGPDWVVVLFGAVIILSLLLGSDAWGLRTRLVLARVAPAERHAVRAQRAQRAEDAAARRALQAQQKAREKRMAVAQKEQTKKIVAAEKAVALAEAGPTRRVSTYVGQTGTVTLFGDRIQTPAGTAYFRDGDVTATVDTAGNLSVTRRSTLTRMGAGTLLLGPVGLLGGAMLKKASKHDSRELYLLIEAPTLVASIGCRPNDGANVRAFAARIMTTARSYPSVEQRLQAGTTARQQLEVLRSQA